VGHTKILEKEKDCNNWWKHRHLSIIESTCTGCPHPKSLRRSEV